MPTLSSDDCPGVLLVLTLGCTSLKWEEVLMAAVEGEEE